VRSRSLKFLRSRSRILKIPALALALSEETLTLSLALFLKIAKFLKKIQERDIEVFLRNSEASNYQIRKIGKTRKFLAFFESFFIKNSVLTCKKCTECQISKFLRA
jgi:hypothetical protein